MESFLRHRRAGCILRTTMQAHIIDPEIRTPLFQAAELRSESTRVGAILGVLAGLFVVIMVRGALALADGRRGEAWPFAALLGAMMLYEMARLRFVRQALALARSVPRARWVGNLLLESMLPAVALFLQIYTPSLGPERALASPLILAWLLFTMLSTLHLDPALSRLAGLFSAAGYATVAAYIFSTYPEIPAHAPLVVYGTAFSYVAFLLAGGFAAGAVAGQIRDHVVAALHDAEHRATIARYAQDLGIARSIQQGLLPTSSPVVAGFEVAGWNLPADETGGDYYDWQQLSDGRVAVTVADVTGHGIGPALIMAACRAYARAGLASDPDLQQLLHRLNRLLCEDIPPGKFVTLAAGLIDPQYSTAQLISAGHGPLLYYCAAEDTFLTFDAQGPPLGMMRGVPYAAAHTFRFERGDLLALVTDGCFEAPNAADDDFGIERLQAAIRAHRDKSPERIIAEMRAAIAAFTAGAPQADDITALIVKRL